jgi:hypothetical protein
VGLLALRHSSQTGSHSLSCNRQAFYLRCPRVFELTVSLKTHAKQLTYNVDLFPHKTFTVAVPAAGESWRWAFFRCVAHAGCSRVVRRFTQLSRTVGP